MAIGKNKKLGKKKKGNRKVVDAFARKEWFDVKAPKTFDISDIGKTVASKSQGTKLARDNLMGRVFTVSLGDLKKNGEDAAFRKFQLKVEEVAGKQCLTNFYGLDMTTDKLRSLVRKKHTLIEGTVDVKTTDGYVLRVFAIGFTQRHKHQARDFSYAQSAQIRAIRLKMNAVMKKEISAVDLNQFVEKLIPATIGDQIKAACECVYPLKDVYVRKVKMLRAPKTDAGKIYELYGGVEKVQAAGKKVEVQEAAPVEEQEE